MFAHLLPAVCASVFSAVGCQRDNPVGPPGVRARADVAPPRDTALAPIADTYLRQGSPNQNQGAELILRLQSSGKNRALLRWDQQGLAQAVAGGTVSSARLELTIADLGDNWSTAGRTIELHRMTQAWTELGATWSCAVDSVPGNSKPECAGATAWDMDHGAAFPFAAETTATALLKNGQTGVVTFDVTADVLAWLGGQPNDGWILKKAVEGDPGSVDFGSRESSAVPRLVLTLRLPESWQVLSEYPALDTTRLVHPPGDTTLLFYRTNVALLFRDGVSDSAKRVFLARNLLTVLGIGGGQFFVTMPDPGPDLDSLYAALRRLRAQPEIYTAVPIPFTPLLPARFARFPTDGPGQTRLDWLDGSSLTWAMRAIRAPLAWGCENGTYGGPHVRVGVFEWKHAQTHPELAPSSPVLREPPVGLNGPPVSPDTLEADRTHSIEVAGLVSAAGDNGSGIAGVVWATQLFLYAGTNASNRRLPLTTGFYVLAELMVKDGIRILTLSSDGRYPANWTTEQRNEDILQFARTIQVSLLDKLPSLLVVVAAGNERSRRAPEDYYQDSLVAPLRAALLLLRQDPKYRDRILVVAGTEDGNVFWDHFTGDPNQGSNFFSQATDIGAPAREVTVLGQWSGQTGSSVPLATATGTSLSAPLVAGVAAMLWTMDPTLPADSVKHYIVRGAQEPRLSATSGGLVPATPVIGAPGVIYQLDAYGALTLLSRERPGTAPLCGYGAELGVSADGGSLDHILLRRSAALADTIGLSADWPTGVSLAQGGRVIAVSGPTEQGQDGTIFINRTGQPAGPSLVGLYRRFLEHGTVDLDWNTHGNYPLAIVKVGGDSISRDWVDIVGAGIDISEGDVIVSPAGDYAAVFAWGTAPGGCGALYRWAVVQLANDAITELRSVSTGCAGPVNYVYNQGMAWSPDGRTITALAYHFQDLTCGIFTMETLVSSLTIGGTPLTGDTSGVYLSAPAYSADGVLLITNQLDAATQHCTLAAHVAGNLTKVASSLDLPNYVNFCLMGPYYSQARSPSNLAARHRPVTPPLPPTGPQRVDCQPTAPPKR